LIKTIPNRKKQKRTYSIETRLIAGFTILILTAAFTAAAAVSVDLADLNVGDDTPKGTVIYKGNPATRDIPGDWETVWNQWYSDGWEFAMGSMWYDPDCDMKTADNFKTDSEYDDYVLAGFDAGFVWWCGPDQEKGLWALVWSDGGGKPASTEPYEFGMHPGWHKDLEYGTGGLGYADIPGLEWADYWTYDNIEETGEGSGCYKEHAHMEDAEGFGNSGYYWRFDSTRDYWFCVQRYDGLPWNYGGFRDWHGHEINYPPNAKLAGYYGPEWEDPDPEYLMDAAFVLYGVPAPDDLNVEAKSLGRIKAAFK
jgi:hypothetical protein